jgi:hypothetical protein
MPSNPKNGHLMTKKSVRKSQQAAKEAGPAKHPQEGCRVTISTLSARLWKSFWWLLYLVGFYVSFSAALLTHYPFVSVSVPEQLDKKSCDSPRFLVSNESPLPLHNVHYYSELIEGDANAPPSIRTGIFAAVNISNLDKLASHTSYSMRMDYRSNRMLLQYVFQKPIIQIWVQYSLPFIPFKEFRRGFQFFALRNGQGEYIWYPLGPGKTFMSKEPLPNIND